MLVKKNAVKKNTRVRRNRSHWTAVGLDIRFVANTLVPYVLNREMAAGLPDGPMVVAVNPGSLLASKMVKDGFGIAGNDLSIGADILCDAALGERFAQKSGTYFDNDTGRFAEPNSAALDYAHRNSVMQAIEDLVSRL